MADDAPKVLGGTAIRPKERHGWEAVKYLLYNPETGEVLTRTPKSWALITVFYLIYYSCLAAFWAAMMAVFLQTLPTEHRPKLETTAGLIGKSPGLGLRPAQSEDFLDSSMIMYDPDEQSSWQGWAARCKEFLDKNYVDKKPTESLEFDITALGPCGKGNYGYDEGKPCIFLKLNKIYNLEHTYYTKENIDPENPAFQDLEEESQKSVTEMPDTLKTFIASKSGDDAKHVWVDCQPKNPADKEVLPTTNIKYYPEERGFSSKYFPFKGQKNYHSPLVAVQFEPKTRGQLVHIECRAWAGNIGYNRRDKIGIASFEIRLL